MNLMSDARNWAFNYLMNMDISDFLDILIVAYLIYKAIWFLKRTNSRNVAKGIIVVLLALGVSSIFRLTMINFLLTRVVELGLLALVILFQPELRRVLERMGSGLPTGRIGNATPLESAIAQTVLACKDMSASRTGALIIFERKVKLNDIMSTGTIINADTTAELIKNLFYDKAPLHDGAVIIREGHISAAGCVLPLTKSMNLSKDLGMRHRAGIGLSEQADAVVIIVSEETGAISVAIEGMLKRHLNPVTLDKLLRTELVPAEDESSGKGIRNYIKKLFKVNANEESKSDKKNI